MASLTSLHDIIYQSSIEYLAPKQTTIDRVGGILCNVCRLTFATKQSYDVHYRTHGLSDIVYTCNICYKEIVGYPSFRGHCYTSHVIKERFQCEHCLKQFSKISNLKDHVNKIHKFKCPTCRKEFPSKKEMQLHRVIHNGLDQPPYNCNTCKTEIETADECKEHVEKHLKFLYACPICNDNILDKDNAAHHMNKHFDKVVSEDKNEIPPSEDTFEETSGIMCQFCSLILEDRVKFDAHFSCEHGDEDIVYMCVECGKSFEKYSVFKNHCDKHILRNMYKCELCKKSFPRLSMLAAHTAACQVAGAAGGGARDRKVFACPSCERRFASMWRWREHLRLEHDINDLPCSYESCDRTFDTPKQLILHQQSHEVTNQNFCSQCRLVFSSAAACERHIDSHKKKIFYCPVCKRNAKDKKIIMKHIAKHFEIISHLCRVCGKVFNTKRSLLEHLKIHKKVKSYSCSHCPKSFLKPSQLEQHVNTHTGSKPYKCPICVKSFSNYPNWVKHVRRMHHEMSIYIKKPAVDQSDEIESGDSPMETAVNENDFKILHDQISNDIYNDNKKVNNNYQLSNIIEPNTNVNSDHNVIDINHLNNVGGEICKKDEAVGIHDKEIQMEIAVDEKHSIYKNTHLDDKKAKIVEVNHIQNINIKNQVDHTAAIKDELPIDTMLNKNNDTTRDIQKENFEQSLIADEQITNALSSKPHKCPICDKTFAKYSYMTKHVGRVHHIRTIDIKNLMSDDSDTVADNISSMETTLNEENVVSTDNRKDDNHESVPKTEKVKIQIISNIELVVDGSKQYKCPVCDKSFAKYPYMTKHVRQVHHKKAVDIKNPATHSTVVDEILSVDTGFGEENEMSMDVTKIEHNETITNSDIVNIKPHKCPICEKSFAKLPYVTKHIRKVHNKKIVDIKSTIIDNKEGVDGNVFAMDTSIDGESELSIDNMKDDISGQFLNVDKMSNIDHIMNIGPKPYKCSTCDKSFAKHSYVTKHVRTVHNRKGIDIKNPMVDYKDSVDDDCSTIETVGDEDNDIFTDHSKDDNDEWVSNTDHTDNGYKPYKCPMCEKSFAKDRYCRKHVRRVHYKNNVASKIPIIDPTQGPVLETLVNAENQIIESQDYMNSDISNTHSISNIVIEAETADCLNDIDNANASIDFANVKLENYIFSVQRDSPIDIVPSMPDGKYLLNDNNNSDAINKHYFKDNDDGNPIEKGIMYASKANLPIVTELVNENGEAIALVEKDLFNANVKESGAVAKDLFSGNTEENDSPIDILEYIAEMPENNSLFVPVISEEALTGAPLAVEATYPYEFGPEFSGLDACAGSFIDLDDHMLPHIDPLLTINQPPPPAPYPYPPCDYNVTVAGYQPAWDPPIITKLCDQYAYGYGEMPEASRVSIMNTDIF